MIGCHLEVLHDVAALVVDVNDHHQVVAVPAGACRVGTVLARHHRDVPWVAVGRDEEVAGLHGDVQRAGQQQRAAHHVAVVAATGVAVAVAAARATATRTATTMSASAHAAATHAPTAAHAAHASAVTVATTHASTATTPAPAARCGRCVGILTAGSVDDPMAVERVRMDWGGGQADGVAGAGGEGDNACEGQAAQGVETGHRVVLVGVCKPQRGPGN